MFDCSTLAQVFVHEAGTLAKAVDVFSLLSAGIVTHVIQFSSEQGIIVPQGIRFLQRRVNGFCFAGVFLPRVLLLVEAAVF